MTRYCTLADARAELKTTSTSTTDDAQLERYIRQVSKRIDSTMGYQRWPFFAPTIDTRTYPVNMGRVDSQYNTFRMDHFILALTAVTRGGETVTSSVELFTDRNAVARHLRLTNWTASWYDCGACGDDQPPYWVAVTGVWGWHEDYDNAWDKVDDVADIAGINATDTTVTVADADGADLDGFTPRFSAGNLIQIGSEWLEVLAVDTDHDTLTVRRGVNGSTAAAHALGADISVYRVDERIRRVAIRQSSMLYARRGSYQVETLDGVGVVSYPQDLLNELKGVLTEFQYG
jgi:hypothetical protein